MTDTTSLRLEAMEAIEGTTDGPWRFDGPVWNQIVWSDHENRLCFMAHSSGLNDDRDIANARFIAASWKLVKDFIAASEAQDKRIAELEAELEQFRVMFGPIGELTAADMSNIVAYFSYELEPSGPLPNWHTVAMALVKQSNDLARVTAERDAERAVMDELAGALVHMASQFQHPDQMADTALAAYAKHKEGRG